MPQSTQGRTEYLSENPDIIDLNVFEQILEMDDDPDDREFSREIVVGFFEQATHTIENMERHLDHPSDTQLKELSDLGHFLKGSSATLGLVKVQKSCEKIQNFGKHLDGSGSNPQPDDAKSIRDIRSTVKYVEVEVREAQTLLSRFFGLEF